MERIYDTKSNYIFDTLKKKILSGEISQGDNIVISRVAEEYGLSSIPVREALKRLEAEGLVNIIPHKGAQVITLDVKRIHEVIAIRGLLEGYATREAVKYFDEAALEKLIELNERMRALALSGDDEKFAILNKEFHRAIYEKANNMLLYNMIFNLWDGGNWTKSLFAFYPEKMNESVKEHEELITALREKKEEIVEFLTRNHKIKNMELYVKLAQNR